MRLWPSLQYVDLSTRVRLTVNNRYVTFLWERKFKPLSGRGAQDVVQAGFCPEFLVLPFLLSLLDQKFVRDGLWRFRRRYV